MKLRLLLPLIFVALPAFSAEVTVIQGGFIRLCGELEGCHPRLVIRQTPTEDVSYALDPQYLAEFEARHPPQTKRKNRDIPVREVIAVEGMGQVRMNSDRDEPWLKILKVVEVEPTLGEIPERSGKH